MEFLAAIEPYHDFNNLLLLFYACHRARHFVYIYSIHAISPEP